MSQATPSLLPPTQSDLRTEYIGLVAYQNPLINAYVDPVIKIQSNVYSGMMSGLYANAYLYGQQIYTISTTGQFLPKQLASWNIPPISAGAYALGTCQLPAIQTSDVVIPIATQLQDSDGNLYQTTATIEIPIGQLGVISYRSNLAASGFQLATGATLTLAAPISGISQLIVINSNGGADVETDTSAQARLLDTTQNPPQGGNKIDYQNWARESDPSITGVTVNIYKNLSTGDTEVHIYLLGGQLDITALLNNPAVQYSRFVSPSVVTTCSNYIEGKRPVTDIVIEESALLYTVSVDITASVKLVAGYTLDDIEPSTQLSVRQLITRELRRPIVLTSQQPSLVGTTYYITRDSITTSIMNTLNANPLSPGTIAQLIYNIELTIPVATGLVVPNPNNSPQILYDLPANQTNVTIVSI